MSTSFELQQPGGFRRDFYLIGKYLKLNLMAALEYKAGFLTILTSIILTLGVWWVYWSIILGVSGNVFGTWGSQQFIVWYFFTEFSIGLLGLFTALYSFYMYVIEDGLEPVLAQPFHPLVQILGRDMYFVSLARSLFAFVILAVGSIFFEIRLNLVDLVGGIVLSICGVVMLAAVYLIIQTLAFWLGDVEFLVELLADVEMNFVRLPQNIVAESLLFSLFIIMPVGLFATIPTMFTFSISLFASLTPLMKFGFILTILLLTYIFVYLSVKALDKGLGRYDGVGE